MVSGLLGTGSALLGSLASVDEARDPRVAAPLLLAPSPAGRAVGRLPEALLRSPAGCLRTPRDRHLPGPHPLGAAPRPPPPGGPPGCGGVGAPPQGGGLVVAARGGKEPRHSGQDAELVLDEDGDRVLLGALPIVHGSESRLGPRRLGLGL